jgi:hypothetical protein
MYCYAYCLQTHQTNGSYAIRSGALESNRPISSIKDYDEAKRNLAKETNLLVDEFVILSLNLLNPEG